MIGEAGPPRRLGRRNPLAKVGAALVFSLPLLSTLDPRPAAAAIAVTLLAVPLFGVRYAHVARRGWPLALSAVSVVATLVPFAAERTGEPLLAVGPWVVTTGLLTTAAGLGLRIVAVALPGLVVLATVDPTDLADALVQNLRVPARFALGALAALRLLPLLREEWVTLTRARRARGVAATTPAGHARAFADMVFALLVGAIRHGTRLAVAMEARGLGGAEPRSFARRARFGAADWLLLGGAAVLAAGVLRLA